MSEPPRLVDSGLPDVASLLRSGEQDVPPAEEQGKRRIRAAAASSVLWAATPAVVASPKALKKAGWLGAAITVAAVSVLSVHSLLSGPASRTSAPSSTTSSSSTSLDAPTTNISVAEPPSVPSAPSVQVQDLPTASLEPASPQAATRAAGRERNVGDELALIDAARVALASKQPAIAHARLQHYRATFANPRFVDEADALDIQALAALGRHDEAQAQAERFFAAHPDSPYRQRVRSAVGAHEHDERP